MKRTKAQLIEELKAQAKFIKSLQEANKTNDIELCLANDTIRAGFTKHNEMSMEIQSLKNQVKDMSDMLEARDSTIKTISEKLEKPYTSKTADEAFLLLGKACAGLSLIQKECTCGAADILQQ